MGIGEYQEAREVSAELVKELDILVQTVRSGVPLADRVQDARTCKYHPSLIFGIFS